jgi:transcriptional regulator with XRE-family HTH domain
MNSSNSSVDVNGNAIRLIREQKGLTQLYLATVVGVTTDTISRWENRRYPSIKLENARKLAEALEVSLEELLEPVAPAAGAAEADGPVVEIVEPPVGPTAAAISPAPIEVGRLQRLLARRRLWIGVGGGLLAVVVVVGVVLWGNRSGIRAVRIMPAHTAANLPFPVLIRATGAIDGQNTLLIREELRGDCESTGTDGEGAIKQFGKNPRWIGKLNDGKAAFLYLVEPGKKLRTDEKLGFSGDVVSREGQSVGDTVGGPSSIVIAPYHWADSDKDYVISDSEILKVYETYSIPGENLINFTAIEELWLAGRYAWNKKTQTFVPSSPTDPKE